MNSLRPLYQLALGDFRERVRRYSFLWMLIGTSFFGYLVITGQYSLVFIGYAAEQNSAWVGSLMAMFCAINLSIFGFFLVRTTVRHDLDTGVGEILATTPVTRLGYLTSKWLSNFVILISLTGVLILAAILMLALSESHAGLQLGSLLAPFVYITLPVVALTAGLAVLFETTRFLRGTLGNIIYFMGVEGLIVHTIAMDHPIADFVGTHRLVASMKEALVAAYPGATPGTSFGLVAVDPTLSLAGARPFVWDGFDWTGEMILFRLGYVLIGWTVVAMASTWFDRFDPARKLIKSKPAKRDRINHLEVGNKPLPANTKRPAIAYSALRRASRGLTWPTMIAGEARLSLKGHLWIWYGIGISLIAAQAAVPYDIARDYLLPAAWVFPLMIWSTLATRDRTFGTETLLHYCSRTPLRLMAAKGATGILIALAISAPLLIRSLIVGDTSQTVTLLVAVLFVPSCALLLGELTGSRKLFEVTYLLLWYVGPVEGLAALDFLGTTQPANGESSLIIFLVIGILALPAALLARTIRLKRA